MILNNGIAYTLVALQVGVTCIEQAVVNLRAANNIDEFV